MAKWMLLTFNKDASKVEGFVIACKLYIRMRIREILVEDRRANIVGFDIYVERISRYLKEKYVGRLKDRKTGVPNSGGFPNRAKKKFDSGDDKLIKIAELKKVEQESKIIKQFVQEFRRAVKRSKYEGKLLIKKFKRGINNVIRHKLMEAERSPRNIKQWYKQATNLDK